MSRKRDLKRRARIAQFERDEAMRPMREWWTAAASGEGEPAEVLQDLIWVAWEYAHTPDGIIFWNHALEEWVWEDARRQRVPWFSYELSRQAFLTAANSTEDQDLIQWAQRLADKG